MSKTRRPNPRPASPRASARHGDRKKAEIRDPKAWIQEFAEMHGLTSSFIVSSRFCPERKALAGSSIPAHSSIVLAHDQPSPEQLAIYRRMTPARRLELAEGLCWTARQMKAAWLRAQHPDWTDAQVRQEVARIFSHART